MLAQQSENGSYPIRGDLPVRRYRIAAVVGTSLIFPNRLLDRLWELNRPGAAVFHAVGRISGVLLLALGIGTAAAAAGLLHRRNGLGGLRWCYSIDGCRDVLALLATGDKLRTAFGVAASATFLFFLTRLACGGTSGKSSDPMRLPHYFSGFVTLGHRKNTQTVVRSVNPGNGPSDRCESRPMHVRVASSSNLNKD